MEEKKESFVKGLIKIWWVIGVSIFSVFGFIFGILSFYKLFDGANTFLSLFRFFNIYIWIFTTLVLLLIFEQVFLPNIRKTREKRKKEFYNELRKELKIK